MATTTCTAQVRFYAELNDFLCQGDRQQTLPYRFNGVPPVKDAIEAVGVPHVEVDLILVNGESVGLTHPLHDRDRVAVYPVFESLDITALTRLRETPLRRTAFLVDGHLGKLVRLLRLLGFDTLQPDTASDAILASLAVKSGRILLTRDRGLLKRRILTHGYWVRSTSPLEQVREVVRRFDLGACVHPFTRCLVCNGPLAPGDKAQVVAAIAARQDATQRCENCGKFYWWGTHAPQLAAAIDTILRSVRTP
jgi:uncharacterized protein